jgi:ABC-type multidrug transport system fused ATPase/permease subunit
LRRIAMRLADHRLGDAVALLGKFGAPHRPLLRAGLLATTVVVACRLAMPWPLRGVLEIATGASIPLFGDGSWVSQTLWLAAMYVAIATLLGYVEMRQRVALKAFATATVHDLRDSAVTSLGLRASGKPFSDLLSRIIGDTARAKAELSGILVHVSQNGLLFIAVCALFVALSVKLSLFFLVGGLFAVAVGYRATRPIGEVTRIQREREAQYAQHVQELFDGDEPSGDRLGINNGSADADVSATKLIALSAWIVHVGLAVVTGAALLTAVHEVKLGRIGIGEVFLFIAYVLTVHRRMIQVGRQLARAGKLVANITRVGELLAAGAGRPSPLQLPALGRSLDLVDLTIKAEEIPERRPRLHPISLSLARGSKVAIIGETGAGKTTLLQLCSGLIEHSGKVIWDGRRVSAEELGAASDLAYVPQQPSFGTHKLQRFIPERSLLESDAARVLGLRRWLKESGGGIKTPVSSGTMTRHEAQAVLLAQLFWKSSATVWLVDDAVGGMPERRARRLLRTILVEGRHRTLVVALQSPLLLERFDRLIVLKAGQILFDGQPQEWAGYAKGRVRRVS